LLVLQIGKRFDAALLFLQELVEKVDQQVFVILFTKQLLEAEVGERVQIGGRLH